MKVASILKLSDRAILRLAKELRVAYKLKLTLRYDTKRDENSHSESVAEHVFALIYLAEYFLVLEDPKKKLDVLKLYRMLLFHDFGEIVHGDIISFLKTKDHEARERKDAKKVFSLMPNPIRAIARKSWQEYEARKSSEAKFAYALDKIEPLFELLDPKNEATAKRIRLSEVRHLEKKIPATKDFPIMRRFVDVITKDMRKRGVFWEG